MATDYEDDFTLAEAYNAKFKNYDIAVRNVMAAQAKVWASQQAFNTAMDGLNDAKSTMTKCKKEFEAVVKTIESK